MSDVEVKRWENKLLEISLWMIRYRKEFWFFGKEVASALGYSNPKEAIQDHVTNLQDKTSIVDLLGPNYKIILQESFSMGRKMLPIKFFQKLHPDYKIIKEIGIYCFCMKSRMKKVEPFQRWVYETIKTIRETGSYTLPQELPIENPLDLVEKVAKIKTVEKETQTQQSSKKIKMKTLEKGTQTRQNVKDMEKFLRKLKNKMEKSIKEIEFELEESFREISSSSSSSSRRSSSDDF